MATTWWQSTPLFPTNPQTAPLLLSAAALAEAEAAHAAQGIRIQQAREAHAQQAAAVARLEEEVARKEAAAFS